MSVIIFMGLAAIAGWTVVLLDWYARRQDAKEAQDGKSAPRP